MVVIPGLHHQPQAWSKWHTKRRHLHAHSHMWNPSTPSHEGQDLLSTPMSQGFELLPVRTACNHCRSKKIRCDKAPVEQGGCSRCRKEGIACNYDVREPIGRPKKRKGDMESFESSLSPMSPPGSMRSMRRRARGSTPTSAAETPAGVSPTPLAGWLTQGSGSRMLTNSSSSQSRSSPYPSSAGLSTTTRTSIDRSSSTSAHTAHQQDESPTLSDLGLAAFLESLDTLEINTEDGLTPNMLQGLHGEGAAKNGEGGGMARAEAMAEVNPSLFDGSRLSFSSLMNAQASTSYAVPADFSWADPSWLLNGLRSQGMPSVPSSRLALGDTDTEPPISAAVKVEGPCPKTGKASCCCDAQDTPEEAAPMLFTPAESSTRVHCVPNPTGRGCTCLCDMHSLINVRATLRQARAQTIQNHNPVEEHDGRDAKGAAASTLQLTLSASQAVAAQCACSASCPTCRSDPNTSLSASLLVSTALQIYVRAVQTLRQGFGAQDVGMTGGADGAAACLAGAGSDWDVSIGNYKPRPANARRIALFAMKLELISLRDALGKVSSAACSIDVTSTLDAGGEAGVGSIGMGTGGEGVNPIDQVVIRKLHQQLGELLSTVESIERQQDAERGAI